MASTATKIVLGIGCVMLLAIGGGLATCAGCVALFKQSADRSGSPSAPRANEADPYAMWGLCKENVKARLRAPSTAEFVDDSILDMQSHVFHDLRKHKTANDYLVKGQVDSQNGFGARLRSVYECSITWTGGERYLVRFTHVFTR